jgi:hypothetical protein
MYWFEDVHERRIRLTDERWEHIMSDHPEMFGQLEKISETVSSPDCIMMSRTDDEVELFYRYYHSTPVKDKFMCVVLKVTKNDLFIITAYFTDTVKRGEVLWQKK